MRSIPASFRTIKSSSLQGIQKKTGPLRNVPMRSIPASFRTIKSSSLQGIQKTKNRTTTKRAYAKHSCFFPYNKELFSSRNTKNKKQDHYETCLCEAFLLLSVQ